MDIPDSRFGRAGQSRVGEAGTLLRLIGAVPRPAGSPAESAAREVCAAWLADAGFEVQERPFTYSAWPGTWGTVAVGLALAGIGAALAVNLLRGVDVPTADAWALGALLVVAGGAWWLGRRGTRDLPVCRRSSVNLEARRGGHEGEREPPLVWLIAHLDSKSQPISLLQRSAATVTLLAAWVALVVWICLAVLGVSARTTGVVLSILAAVAALPLILSRPASKSAGTLDNASGVASIVLAARRMDPASPVGVVLTSAEEFGLAGARAWVEGRRRGIAINCDGVDDSGRVTITAGRGGRELLCRHRIHGFLGPEVRIRRSLPGILLDSTAFSDCGWRACTLSRGTLASLARVHTQRDTLDSLTGTGVEGAANLIVGLAGAIIAEEARTEK